MATKWGIVSAGMISHDFVNALSTLDKSEHVVVAVATRSIDSAKTFAEKHGIPKAYGSYAELAQDPEIEIVYVGAIHPAHLEICKLMFNAGKHILCEKPMAMNVKETKEIVATARSKKLFLMEAVWSRFLPAYVKLKEDIDKNKIGDVLSVNVAFGHVEWRDRGFKKELGGGTTLDMGIYCIQLASLVYGGEKPLKVLAGGHLNEYGIDESVSFTFVYSGGRTASLQTHTRVKFDCAATVYGTQGSMTIPDPFWCSTRIDTPEGTFDFPLPEAKLPFIYTNSAGLRYEAQHARECIRKGLTESPIISLDETLLLAELMEDVRKQVGVDYPQDH